MENDGVMEDRGNSYPPEEFERQFNPRQAVPEVDDILDRRPALSEATRRGLPHELDHKYGDGEREVVDIFPAATGTGEGAPVLVFFHGGYWRGGHAREYSFVAGPFVEAGACVFVATYDLCPDVSLAHIVDQAERAILWVAANAARFGGDPANIHLAGHSAGAHLSAMALACDWGARHGRPDPMIAGACLISGIYDLEAVRQIAINSDIGARAEDVPVLSPLALPPRRPVPMIVGVGLGETEEWVRQSHLYADVARGAGCAVELIEVPAMNHFTIMVEMPEPTHPITAALTTMLEVARAL